MPIRQLHVLPVKALGFIPSGKARKNDGNLCFFCRPFRFRQQSLRCIALRIAAGCIYRAGQELQRLRKPQWVDMAGTCPLIAQIFRHCADNGDFCI